MICQLYLLVLIALLPLRARCQSVQDSWTAPASPDRSTNMQSGTPFTIRWKSSLQEWFSAYCSSCDVRKADLWVTSFTSNNYNFKVAGSIDVTSSSSYQWDVNLPLFALSMNGVLVFRFAAFNAQPPFDEQISSAGFIISGPVQPSTVVSVVTLRPSSTTSTISSAGYSISYITSRTTARPSPTATSTLATSVPQITPEDKTWIAGVVVGPLVGIALGAAVMWSLLRRRKNRNAQRNPAIQGYTQAFGVPDHDNNSEDKYPQPAIYPTRQSQVFQPWQYTNVPVEAPGTESRELAELSQGDYR